MTELVTARVRGISLDRCTACNGVWFDAGEIEILQRRALVEPRSRTASKRAKRNRSAQDGGFLSELAGRALEAMVLAAMEAAGTAAGGC